MIFSDRWHPIGISFISESEDIFAVSGGANYGIKGNGGIRLFKGQKVVWEWSTPKATYDVKGNSEMIFAAGKSGTIYALDHQKNIKKALNAHSREIDRLALHKEKGLLASCSWDGYLKLWDSKMMKLIHSIIPAGNLNVAVNEASFSPDGNIIASVAMEGPLTLWDVRNGQRIKQIPVRSPFLSVDWSYDGRHLAAGGIDHNIYVYDPFSSYTSETILSGHYESVRQLRWTSNTKLMSVGYDMSVRWWDIHSLNPLIKVDSSFTEFVTCCDVQKGTGRQIIGCWDRTIRKFYD